MPGDESPRPPDVHKPRGRFGRLWLRSCVFHLLDLPEWALFPSDGERDRAMADVTYGRFPGLVGWFSRPAPLIFLSLVSALGIISIVGVLTLRVNVGVWRPIISLAVYLGAGAGAAWFVHRPAVIRFLRQRLAQLRVRVCGGCGYDLRGQDAATRACPECGRAMIEGAGPQETRPGA